MFGVAKMRRLQGDASTRPFGAKLCAMSWLRTAGLGRGAGLWLVGALAASTALGACIASGPPIDPITGDDDDFDDDETDPPVEPPVVPPEDPHAVQGATPSHGPWSGGQRVIVAGNGYGPSARVWFGAIEATDVLVIDATKLQVTAPASDPGTVDLTTQNGDDESTRRTLVGGYTFDAVYADPNKGPVSGGTEVVLLGKNTSWDADTVAAIGQKDCLTTTFVSPTELVCVAPQGTPGSKTLRVTDGDETLTVLDGYTYEDSSDGFKGGLSGEALGGSLTVLAFNNITGDPLAGATVIVGAPIEDALVATIGSTGTVVIEDPSLTAPRTVTVAAKCHSPVTFVDVPVDTVTVYLDPVLTPSCIEGFGTPPGVGGGGVNQGYVSGEIVFPKVSEFENGPFQVPEPVGNEEKVAYVLPSTSNPLVPFTLPSPVAAIRPEDEGGLGFSFSLASLPGNRTFYAVAGLEDRSVSPPRFQAYWMGLVRGVPVTTDTDTTEVYIDMRPLDLALTLDATPPPPGSPGPDRFLANVAIRLGPDGFAVLPQGQKAPLLPLSGPLQFVGLPLLDGAFDGSTYTVSARAVTGPSFTTPLSVVASQKTNTTAFPIVLDGFVGRPGLAVPATNAAWNRRDLTTTFGAGAPVDLTVVDVVSTTGSMHWLVAIPGGARSVTLPDLSGVEDGALPEGAISTNVIGARFTEAFDYGAVTYRELRPQGMDAYAQDVVEAFIP
jgi:hypothetical protein